LGTTAADARRRLIARWSGPALGAAAAIAVAIASCAPPPKPAPTPEPEPAPVATPPPPSAPTPLPPAIPAPGEREAPAEPLVRVGVVTGAASATIASQGGLTLSDPSGARLAEIPAGQAWRLAVRGGGIVAMGPGGATTAPSERFEIVSPDSDALVEVNGRPYRGAFAAVRDSVGLTLVDRLPMEAYLAGVVSAEMGRRRPEDQQALEAQAVVSRTFALRHLGRRDRQGFDLYATVADQVYGGAAAESPEGREAVDATRGQVLTWDGTPIDAFFYSTCGGHTASGTEVFRAADRPYLRSVSDLDDSGVAYCSISPRYRWHEEWSGDALRTVLRRTLPEVAGVRGGDVAAVRDVRVARRTPSGRVGELSIGLPREEVRVEGANVRRVLRPVSGEILRSAAFTLTVNGAGRRVTRLAADGQGAGHGVGFCQWGAVGRSRAGQEYRRILAAYFPGTQLERLY
jgi:stage II sporulation protein D